MHRSGASALCVHVQKKSIKRRGVAVGRKRKRERERTVALEEAAKSRTRSLEDEKTRNRRTSKQVDSETKAILILRGSPNERNWIAKLRLKYVEKYSLRGIEINATLFGTFVRKFRSLQSNFHSIKYSFYKIYKTFSYSVTFNFLEFLTF